MKDTPIGARLLLGLGLLNLLFQLTMLSFNILGIPMGLIH